MIICSCAWSQYEKLDKICPDILEHLDVSVAILHGVLK